MDAVVIARGVMMGDVGILRTTIGVESHQRRGDVQELPETLVDTNLRIDLKAKQLVRAGPVPAALTRSAA